MAEPIPFPIRARTARAPFREVVVVCAKCRRKAGGKPLRKTLKRALKSGAWGRKVRVVETSCLDLCPKRRIAVATGAQLAAGRIAVVDRDAQAEAVLDALLPRAEG